MSEKRLSKLLIAPVIAILLGVTIYPILFAYYMSVHDMTILNFWEPTFIGINNFISILTNNDFWYSIRFSLLFMVVVTSIELILGLLMAVFLERPLKGKRILVSLILIPMAIAPALFGIMMKLMLNEFVGIVPFILKQFGITFSFFRDFYTAFMVLTWVDVIQWTPFVFIILYSAVHSLPSEPVDAALIDGASRWQIFRHITLPMLKKTILIVAIFRIMDSFRTFDTIYVMTGGGPGISTTTLSVHIFKLALIQGNFGLAAAATIVFLYLALGILSFGLKYLSREGVL